MGLVEEEMKSLTAAQAGVERGRRISEFLESQVWKKDLSPMLSEMQDGAQESVMMFPPNGNLDASAVAVRDAFFKGHYQAVAVIGERILEMRAQGLADAKSVERLERKSKEV